MTTPRTGGYGHANREFCTTFTRDGLTFDVRDEGPRDGEPIVLLHGFPERASSWDAVAPALHTAGFRTLAPDQRGYSPRARPPRRADYTITQLTDDIVALLDAADLETAHVVGHDWGAVVAWGFAMRYPDRVRTLTALSIPHPRTFLAAMTHTRQGFKSWYIGLFQLPRVPERMARRPGKAFERYLAFSGMEPDEIERFRSEIVGYGALRGGLNWYRAIPFSDFSLLRLRCQVPTTFVWSDQDIAVDLRSAQACEKQVHGDYELVILSGVSHWIPTQAPEACVEAILERVIGT